MFSFPLKKWLVRASTVNNSTAAFYNHEEYTYEIRIKEIDKYTYYLSMKAEREEINFSRLLQEALAERLKVRN